MRDQKMNAPQEGTPLWFVWRRLEEVSEKVSDISETIGTIKESCGVHMTTFSNGLEQVKDEIAIAKRRRFKLVITSILILATLTAPFIAVVLHHIVSTKH